MKKTSAEPGDTQETVQDTQAMTEPVMATPGLAVPVPEAHYLQLGTADNTRRAYRSAIRHFERWGGLLPTDEQTLCRYLTAHAQTLNPRTLELRLCALRTWHRLQHFADPTAGARVQKLMTGIKRAHGRPRQQARALTPAQLRRIAAALQAKTSLKAARDLALLLVGIAGAFRRSELVGLSVEQLRWHPEGLVITLPRSKTDQTGAGLRKAIPYGTAPLCPLKALKAWLARAGIEQGAVFRRVTRWDKVAEKALTPASVNLILKSVVSDCGFEFAEELSGHSLRRTLATSAYRAGASFAAIKRQGGWRHDGTVWQYVEEAGQFEDNAAASLFGAAADEPCSSQDETA